MLWSLVGRFSTATLRHVLAIGAEERQWRAGPNQDTYWNPLGQLCEERPQLHSDRLAHECEVG